MSARTHRTQLRFALPSSLGNDVDARAKQLQAYFQRVLLKDTEVIVPQTYELLARELLAGRVDAAWAPPFVCARIEAMGVRVLVRGIRAGASVYRAALVCRADADLTLDNLSGTRAAWSDRDSIGGYLLPMAYLREKGLDPAKTFARQDFHGNYRKALEAVDQGQADVTSLFAPVARANLGIDASVKEIWPERAQAFKVIAFTDEAPNDGVAVSMSASAALVSELERALLTIHQTSDGQQVMAECFHAEKFELAPRMGYRALYRVALASL